jgi:hypothetical protein
VRTRDPLTPVPAATLDTAAGEAAALGRVIEAAALGRVIPA